MVERPVALIVHQAGHCPLLRAGDRWIVHNGEVQRMAAAKLCGHAVCSAFPKLQDLLQALQPGATLPDDFLLCDRANCDAAFRMEFATVGNISGVNAVVNPGAVAAASGVNAAPPHTDGEGTMIIPASTPSNTRRLERSTSLKGNTIRKAGPFLTRLPKDLAAELVSACSTRRFDDATVIIQQGVVNDHLFIVAEGHVDVAKRSDTNEETILVTLGEGDCFGEMSVLTGEQTSAEVRSRGPSAVLCVHKDELEALLMRRPHLSREFSKLLADRLKATNLSLESELSRGVIGKLSMISLLDLVQTLQQSRAVGTLQLTRHGEQIRLGFRNGSMVAADGGELKGEEAFYRAATWVDGDFCFEQTPPADDPALAIRADNMSLMMEAMRRMDEARATSASSSQSGAAAPAVGSSSLDNLLGGQ